MLPLKGLCSLVILLCFLASTLLDPKFRGDDLLTSLAQWAGLQSRRY
jgi:hypothetical protein